MTRKQAIRELIDLNEVPKFLKAARQSIDLIDPIFNSSKPADEKREAIFEAGVKIGLYSADEVPSK